MLLVETLSAELERVTARLEPYFSRHEAHEAASGYIRALLSSGERKNAWGLSEEAGQNDPYAFQHLIRRARWNPEAVRGEVLKYAREHLGEDGVVAVDETGFLKKGQKSAGVARQYTGTAGRIEDAQVGVFLAYVTPRGHTLIDRELYLPEHWLEDPERCRKAGIGEQVVFRTKPELARLRFLEEHQLRYVLATASNTHVERGSSKQPVAEVLQELNAEDWTTLSAGEGSKGPRLYDWARMKVNSGPAPQQRWLLARRSLKDATDVAYYLVHAPANIWC